MALLAVAPTAHAAVHASQIANVPNAVYLTAPPADAHRVMVVAQNGKVFVVRDGVQLPDPFLDVSADVQYGGEQGLLSIAFAPDYATSRKLYAYYNIPNPSGDAGGQIVVDEFTATDDDHVDKSTRRRLVTIDHPTDQNHNGGTLQFGPDGRLYAGTGDGGGGNDSHHNGQNANTLLGKLLVIDRVNGGASVFALGLRNPFRFSFDRATGDLVIGDVGQGAEEEVDYAPAGTAAGVNYGWPCYEGFERTPGVASLRPGELPAARARAVAQRLGLLRDHRRLRRARSGADRTSPAATSTATTARRRSARRSSRCRASPTTRRSPGCRCRRPPRSARTRAATSTSCR